MEINRRVTKQVIMWGVGIFLCLSVGTVTYLHTAFRTDIIRLNNLAEKRLEQINKIYIDITEIKTEARHLRSYVERVDGNQDVIIERLGELIKKFDKISTNEQQKQRNRP